MTRIGIAGFGYMGKSHLEAIMSISRNMGGKIDVVGIYDPYFTEDRDSTRFQGLTFFNDFSDLLSADVDWVIIATPHDVAITLCKDVLSKGINAFIEKPLGRNINEARQLVNAQLYRNQLWVGLNYRFFDGIHQLIKDVNKGLFGPLISINVLIGHGYIPEGAKTWKLDKDKVGGGVLIDPGLHILDLFLILAGEDVEPVTGLSYRGFWKTNIEEECHLLLRSTTVPIINFQVSVVKWRSTFRIEVYGEDGYGIINGRGRSYGPQTYIRGKRWGWQSGKPQRDTEKIVSHSEEEDIFEKEWQAILTHQDSDEIKPSNAESALQSMELLSMCRSVLGIKE